MVFYYKHPNKEKLQLIRTNKALHQLPIDAELYYIKDDTLTKIHPYEALRLNRLVKNI